MLEQDKSRFKNAEEALRFFFRLHELVHSRQTKEDSPAVEKLATDAGLDDYRSIKSSMQGLDDVALWLLGEIYGPTAFGKHRRSFSHACKAAPSAFPQRQFRPREIVLIHERALGVVKRGLREMGLIPARPPRSPRERKPRIETESQRAYVRADHAAGGA
jgi:hypothetical protein